MLIESIIRREGGTTVPMGAAVYHFLPIEDGRHVAEVTDRAHVERLLSITEGFRTAVRIEAPAPAPVTVNAERPAPPPAEPAKPKRSRRK